MKIFCEIMFWTLIPFATLVWSGLVVTFSGSFRSKTEESAVAFLSYFLLVLLFMTMLAGCAQVVWGGV